MGEFHLIGDINDPTSLDPSDWTMLGILALVTKIFKFNLPQRSEQLQHLNDNQDENNNSD